jgi:putative LysE/RhtB family amino acid efflux pump
VSATAFLMQGLVLGLAVAAAVGPISVLCLRRTLESGFAAGLAGGVGTAVADALYAAVAAFGLTALASLLVEHSVPIRLAGGAALVAMGLRTLAAEPPSLVTSTARSPAGAAALAVTTFGLTMANPMTIVSFTAIFAGLGLGATTGEPLAAAALVAGVFLGSLAWWVALAGGAALLRGLVTPRALRGVNLASGLVILGFAAVVLADVVRGMMA